MQLLKVFALARGPGKALSWNNFASVLAGVAQGLDTLPSVKLEKVSLKVGSDEKL